MWNIEKVRSGKPNKWNYIDDCMMRGLPEPVQDHQGMKVSELLRTSSTFFVQPDGSIRPMTPKGTTTDNVNRAKPVHLYAFIFGDEKCRQAIDTIPQ